MSADEPLALLRAEADRAVAPRPAFAEELWSELASKLAEPAPRPDRGWRALVHRGTMPRRRVTVVAAALLVLLLASAAAATYLGLHAWLGASEGGRREMPSTARLAEKEPVLIDLGGGPAGGNPSSGAGGFTLRLGASRDAGSTTYSFFFPTSGRTESGQPYATVRGTLYLRSDRGTLVIETRSRSLGASGTGAVDGQDVWLGTWRVIGGTKALGRLRGGGSLVGIAGPGARVTLRLTGTLE